MPGRDGTGPGGLRKTGQGFGRGLGHCNRTIVSQSTLQPTNRKETLLKEKERIQSQLEKLEKLINEQ